MSAADATQQKPWNPAKRVAFRFAFTYLILYYLPYPVGALPGTMWLAEGSEAVKKWIAAPIGKHVLRIGGAMAMEKTGSSDTIFGYVKTFCVLALAMVATLVWSVLADRRTNG